MPKRVIFILALITTSMAILNVPPGAAGSYFHNTTFMDFVPVGDLLSGNSINCQLPNLDNVSIPKFDHPMRFSQMRFQSSFHYRIYLIIPVCSQKQMIWPYAECIVTSMANRQPFRDWTKMQFPRNTMRPNIVPSFESKFAVGIPSASIGSCPYPTGRSPINTFPEPLAGGAQKVQMTRTIAFQSAVFPSCSWGGNKYAATS